MASGLVVYASGSPFMRTRRAEYHYPPVSLEAEEPYAPLLDPSYYDSEAVVLVADVYSVWPEVGGYRAESYGEMLEALRSYMERSCSRRLPPRLCGRVEYSVYPWIGEMGGWRFNASTGDPFLYAALASLSAAIRVAAAPRGRRPRSIYTVYSEEQHPLQARLAEAAAATVAAALGVELVEVVQEPQPYPRPRSPPLVRLHEHQRLPAPAAARRLAAGLRPTGRLLRPRGPHATSKRLDRKAEETIAYTAAAAVLASNCMLTALAYASPPASLQAAHSALAKAAKIYEEATALGRRRTGGTVAHGLRVEQDTAAAAALGAALLHRVREALESTGWEPYTPLSPEHLEAVAALTGCPRDNTPPGCLQEAGAKVALREGCLRSLRRQALGEGK